MQQEKRWTTQPFSENKEDNLDKTPKEEISQLNFLDPNSGAHFQYKELLKRLSDITNSSKDKNSSHKQK